MRSAGWGRFVHRIGDRQSPGKHQRHRRRDPAVDHRTAEAVADEYSRFGITVNTVAPGWIGTQNAYDYLEHQVGLSTTEQISDWMRVNAGVPAARMGRPDEIASLIVYLCSDAAGYLTGNWIEVDGGKHRAAF
jgi:3-oxoacyl-[acyl-carrier protein] reductase